ncbi:MAG: hypothetical protein NT038_02520 [Euryarchaeota archaeon]|nr:hypothetical protein [Euryarchaeota archaeon]
MGELRNSDVVTHLIKSLLLVAGRRTLYSFALQVIKTTMKKLEKDFTFLGNINIQEASYSEGGASISTDPVIDTVESAQLGEACDAIIRVFYKDLLDTTGDDAGLYFITELKEQLGDQFVSSLQKHGINFERIQTEQHIRYRFREHKAPQPPKPKEEPKKEEPTSPYTWDTVSTWKYDDNLCFLYKDNGSLLDTLQLDLVIEDYIIRISAPKDAPIPIESTMITMAEKDIKFLEMLREQDMDMELAIGLLHVSTQKFEALIKKLVHLEMLQYISDDEMKLTEKGISFLSEIKKETGNTHRNDT